MGFSRNFGDKTPPKPQNQEQPKRNNEATSDTESITASNQDEDVATHEPGVFPANPVQENRDSPIEDIAVHYVRINRVVEQKANRNKQREDNVRAAELDFMLDLETLIKETAAEPDLIELNCCIEDNIFNQTPNECKAVARKLAHRWDINLVNDRMIVPKTLRYAALNALHFGHAAINTICNDAAIFWWPNMRADIEKKTKPCSACLIADKNLKFQQPLPKNLKLDDRKCRAKKFKLIYPETCIAETYNRVCKN